MTIKDYLKELDRYKTPVKAFNDDPLKHKLCLIEDVFKIYVCLERFNADNSYYTFAGNLFDRLYDLSISDLETEILQLSGVLGRYYRNLTE